jgi:hypothetical protein
LGEVPSNFAFVEKSAPHLVCLVALVERYFADDALAALIKLRLLAEFVAKVTIRQRRRTPSPINDRFPAAARRHLVP